MGSHEIIIDKDVRDWVLVPLLFGIILMKLLQQYAVKARDLGGGGTGSRVRLGCVGMRQCI